MSSLAASRADNFYFPPEWRPEYGSISKFQGSKGANQYEQFGIIRFELPFDAWCLGCNRHMCKGLRFNAKKDKAGKYFSTTIWSFNMKCHSCDQRFIIKTDPKNSTYDLSEGIRKMEQDFVPDPGDSIIESVSDETKDLLSKDPIFRLQHDKEDRIKADSTKSNLYELIDLRESTSNHDYDLNSKLRRHHRTQKKRALELSEEGKNIGLPIPLLEPAMEDSIAAKSAKYSQTKLTVYNKSERKKMTFIQSQSIFQNKNDNKRKIENSETPSKITKIQNTLQKQADLRINTKQFTISQPPNNATNTNGENTKLVNKYKILLKKSVQNSALLDKVNHGELNTPSDCLTTTVITPTPLLDFLNVYNSDTDNE